MTEDRMIEEGLEVSTHALIQSINGLTRKEQRLRQEGLDEQAVCVRHTIDTLYRIRDELFALLHEQKRNRTRNR